MYQMERLIAEELVGDGGRYLFLTICRRGAELATH